MVIKNLLAAVCSLAFSSFFGQTADNIPDSLLLKEYDYFLRKLESDALDTKTACIYSSALLAKAKGENNWQQMVNAYKSILHQSAKEFQMIYADSMIYAARRSNKPTVIASTFLTKGILYYDRKEHIKALDNFLIADGFLLKQNDRYLLHKVRFNIARVKYYLGFYGEALPLFIDCTAYFKEEEDMSYMVSLHHLGLCYTKLKKYNLCTATNDFGIREAFRIELPETVAHFIHSEGINQYFKTNYGTAITKLQQALPDLIRDKDLANVTLAYFYIGKSLWGLHQYTSAVGYFKMVDKAFEDKTFIQPDLRENYEHLITYYKNRKDYKLQIYYTDRLIAADRIIETKYKYLAGKIDREYGPKQLIASKRESERYLAEERRRNFIGSIIIVGLSILTVYLIFRNLENRFYKKKYEEFIERKKKPKAPDRTPFSTEQININPKVVASVLDLLEAFEKEGGYLETDLKQERLAVLFNTNQKYVAKIIKHYRNKKSNDYISDLKIDHVIDLLQNDTKYRRYTDEALAAEVGFGTTQHFTRAFESKTGVSPRFFIKQMNQKSLS